MNSWFYIIVLLAGLLIACSSPKDRIAPLSSHKTARFEEEIDSLLALDLKREARRKIHAFLHGTPSDNYASLSFLYNRLGKSFLLSYHFDSAVYYTKMAYDCSLKLHDKQQQARYAADLLGTYNKASDHLEEQAAIFQILDGYDVGKFTVPTQALVQNAMVEYYQKKMFKVDIYGILLNDVYDSYINYSNSHVLTNEDSVNIALCCIYLSKTSYSFKIILKNSPLANDSIQGTDGERIDYLHIARKWINDKTWPLASYYLMAIYVSFIDDDYNIKRPALYLDSLINLAKDRNVNLNDLIIRGHVYLADNYFYYLEDNKENNLIAREICERAENYNHHLIDSSVTYYLQWLTADLLLREKKYDSALAIYKNITPHLSKYVQLRQLMDYTHSIADCYGGLNMKDSVMVYFELYSKLSDSFIDIDEDRIFKATEVKYQNKIKQDKINVQQTIIQYANRQKLLLLSAIIFAIAFIVLLIILYKKLDKRSRALQVLNRKLEESNKTKAKLFAIISHDFRSPVNQVYQLLKLQRSEGILIAPDERDELEKQTQAAASNLLESMEELLIWSKTQMQSFSATNEEVDVYGICRQCLALLDTLIRDKQLQVNLHIKQGSVIETDHNFLLTILRNLLQNAIKASPEHGQIIIRYETDNEGNALIRISNQGPPYTQQDYMLALFNASNLLKGGLGLLIVNELSKKIGAGIFFGRKGAFTYCDIVFES